MNIGKGSSNFGADGLITLFGGAGQKLRRNQDSGIIAWVLFSVKDSVSLG
jgi:hypothetical protein